MLLAIAPSALASDVLDFDSMAAGMPTCSQDTRVPFMSAFGGITVAMFPNGAVWYSVADDGQLALIDFAKPAMEIAKLGGHCR